jgi:AcrR family transcriptional regulator
MRRQPRQQRGREKVEQILAAAAIVFEEVGYNAATTQRIADRAGAAIGSLYQFFPDKAAIFKAMELRHLERLRAMWAEAERIDFAAYPLRSMIKILVRSVMELFEDRVSRVVFVQFFESREIFQSIDDSLTQEAIVFTAKILLKRNPALENPLLLAEVCVHSSNALILVLLRSQDPVRNAQLIQQIEDLLVAYLAPYLAEQLSNGDAVRLDSNVMKVMKCSHCRSLRLWKNGYRRGKQCYRCKDCGKQSVRMDETGSV